MPIYQYLVANVLRQNCNCANWDGNMVWKKNNQFRHIFWGWINDILPPPRVGWYSVGFKSKSGLQIVSWLHKLKLKESVAIQTASILPCLLAFISSCIKLRELWDCYSCLQWIFYSWKYQSPKLYSKPNQWPDGMCHRCSFSVFFH